MANSDSTSAPQGEVAKEGASFAHENAELHAEISHLRATADAVRAEMVLEFGAQKKLNDYFLQAPFALGVLRGPDHRIEIANPAVLSIWGRDPSIVGMPLVEATPHAKNQEFIGYLDEVYRTGVTFEGKGLIYQLHLPDGSIRETAFDLVYSALRGSDGTIEGILFVAIDVSERVLAEKQRDALRSQVATQERQFRDIVDNLPQLAWTATPEGTINYVNRPWYEYTGKSVEDIAASGSDRTWLYDPSEVEDVTRSWKQSLATGEPFEREMRLRGKDGDLRWFLTRIRPTRDENGKIVRWFGTNIDIDDRRRAEGFRETFLAVLGHDLRNPLTTILTTSRLLRMRKAMPPEHHPQLDRIVRSGTRMERMIGQLLDITRARLAGGIPVKLSDEPIDVGAVVSRIVDEIRGASPHRVIELKIDGECMGRIDADRCEQVVSNLVGNAVTHGDPAAPIRVELSCATDGQREIRLRVSNAGEPIPPEFMPFLFNPFVRGEKPPGPSVGLGLGLYISERIVFAHGGRLLVYSDKEGGTCFDAIVPTQDHLP